MKRILSLLLVFGLSLSFVNAAGLATVEGKWDRGKPVEIQLAIVNNGVLKTVSSTKVDSDNNFYLAFPVGDEGGFYTIGLPGMLRQAKDRYTFYFKPGDKLNFIVTEDSYTLRGKENSPENVAMTQWHDYVAKLEATSYSKSSSYIEFFPLLDKKAKKLPDLKIKKTKNKNFEQAFEEYRKINFADIATSFFFLPRRAEYTNPPKSEYPKWYFDFDVREYTKNDALLHYPGGIELLSKFPYVMSMVDESVPGATPLVALVDNADLIENPELKGEFILRFASNNKTYSGIKAFEEKYGQYLVTDRQKELVQDRAEKLKAMEVKRDAAPDIIAFDKDGNEVRLSSFKGKVVYVDFWATWCTYCIAEFPHLKKLEEIFHDNQDLVFLSISMDRMRDHDKWKKYLEIHNLGGVQLFAGENLNTIREDLNISGYPRFMLIDKDGNFAFADALRPSSPEMEGILRDELSK